jgi:phenylalanyl-tRNA synthetase alpha chain
MAEALQQLILDTLEELGTIEDTRTLSIPGESGPALTNDAQITILGALNSLASRDVRARVFALSDAPFRNRQRSA